MSCLFIKQCLSISGSGLCHWLLHHRLLHHWLLVHGLLLGIAWLLHHRLLLHRLLGVVHWLSWLLLLWILLLRIWLLTISWLLSRLCHNDSSSMCISMVHICTSRHSSSAPNSTKHDNNEAKAGRHNDHPPKPLESA